MEAEEAEAEAGAGLGWQNLQMKEGASPEAEERVLSQRAHTLIQIGVVYANNRAG